MITVGQGKDWKTVLGAIAEGSAERAALEWDSSSGFDGGAYTWSWRNLSESLVKELSLRAAPDPLEAGVQSELLAVVRRPHPPFLTWSATVWTLHLSAHDRHAMTEQRLDEEDLSRLEEELPDRLREAFAKIEAVAPNLEELASRRSRRRSSAFDSVRDIIVDPPDPGYRSPT